MNLLPTYQEVTRIVIEHELDVPQWWIMKFHRQWTIHRL